MAMQPKQRAFCGAEDVEKLSDLIRAMVAVDKGDLAFAPEDLQIEWVDEEAGWIRDLQVWEADERFQAALGCWHEVAADAGTAYAEVISHPEWRAPADIDALLSALSKLCARLVGKPAELRFGAAETQTWLNEAAERNGFDLERIYFRMRNDRDTPFADIALPDGFEIRPLRRDAEVEAWVAAFNESFASHHDAPTYSVEQKRQRMADTSYMPDTDLVLVTPEGEIAGLSLNTKEVLDSGEEHAWVRSIGMRPAWRGTGLGRALLKASLNALLDCGFTTVRLSVDSDNATSALRLYKGTGFEIEFRRMVYLKQIQPA